MYRHHCLTSFTIVIIVWHSLLLSLLNSLHHYCRHLTPFPIAWHYLTFSLLDVICHCRHSTPFVTTATTRHHHLPLPSPSTPCCHNVMPYTIIIASQNPYHYHCLSLLLLIFFPCYRCPVAFPLCESLITWGEGFEEIYKPSKTLFFFFRVFPNWELLTCKL